MSSLVDLVTVEREASMALENGYSEEMDLARAARLMTALTKRLVSSQIFFFSMISVAVRAFGRVFFKRRVTSPALRQFVASSRNLVFVEVATAPGVAGPCAEAVALFATASLSKLSRESVAVVANDIFSKSCSSVSRGSASDATPIAAEGRLNDSPSLGVPDTACMPTKDVAEALEFDFSLALGDGTALCVTTGDNIVACDSEVGVVDVDLRDVQEFCISAAAPNKSNNKVLVYLTSACEVRSLIRV